MCPCTGTWSTTVAEEPGVHPPVCAPGLVIPGLSRRCWQASRAGSRRAPLVQPLRIKPRRGKGRFHAPGTDVAPAAPGMPDKQCHHRDGQHGLSQPPCCRSALLAPRPGHRSANGTPVPEQVSQCDPRTEQQRLGHHPMVAADLTSTGTRDARPPAAGARARDQHRNQCFRVIVAEGRARWKSADSIHRPALPRSVHQQVLRLGAARVDRPGLPCTCGG